MTSRYTQAASVVSRIRAEAVASGRAARVEEAGEEDTGGKAKREEGGHTFKRPIPVLSHTPLFPTPFPTLSMQLMLYPA